MNARDYYKILDISPDASADEIKRAYRKLARKTHPDLDGGPDAEAAFKTLNEAYDVLKDPETRARYDEIRRGGPQRPGGQADWSGGYSFDQGDPETQARFQEFFSSVFGGGGPYGRADHRDRTGPMGGDLHARITLAIEDSYRGATRTITLPVSSLGPDGRIRVEDRTLSVRIPKGVTEGQHIRLSAPEIGGDVFLEATFAPHPVYRVEGRDLFMDLPVTPWEAALGGKIVLPTPGGKVDLTIPANARAGQKLRLRGKGLPGQPAGHLFVRLMIVNPDVTTDEARDVFARMAREMPFDPREKLERRTR